MPKIVSNVIAHHKALTGCDILKSEKLKELFRTGLSARFGKNPSIFKDENLKFSTLMAGFKRMNTNLELHSNIITMLDEKTSKMLVSKEKR